MAKRLICGDCKGKLLDTMNGAFLRCKRCKRAYTPKGNALLYPRDLAKFPEEMAKHEVEPVYFVGAKPMPLSKILALAAKA